MTRKAYALKAEKFEIADPDEDATDGQIRTLNWLLRTRTHSVEFGNDAIDMLENGMTRGDADRQIKHLAKCPSTKRQNASQGRQAAEKVVKQSKVAGQPNKAQAAAAIAQIAAEHGIKLGKVADKHLSVLTAR